MHERTYSIITIILLFFCGNPLFCTSQEPFPLSNPSRVKMLYNSLDPKSIIQHLALHSLYEDTSFGKKALQDAQNLMKSKPQNFVSTLNPAGASIHKLVQFFSLTSPSEGLVLSEEEAAWISKAAQHLPNRQLKGHQIQSEAEVIELPGAEIDLARAIFLSQIGMDPQALEKMRSYESMLDLMALQILVRLPPSATPEQKIREINKLVFEEMQFRFPPHSSYSQDVDLYTFLPSILDSRKGVCLGVSILYLCLAQRLQLPLEMITPPGHIYIRYREGDNCINIETTARGVHIDSNEYLGVNTRSLEERTLKEVIGLAYMNQAAALWQSERLEKALSCYQQAAHYLPDNKQLKEFTAYVHLGLGQIEEGKALLEEIQNFQHDHEISRNTIAEDYLKGNIDPDGIQNVFMHVDETRESLEKKRDKIQQSLAKYPLFRTGHMLLAITWMQLHRPGEALKSLQNYHALDNSDVTVEYYLAALLMERWDYQAAWDHLQRAEELSRARDHDSEALKELRKELQKKGFGNNFGVR